MNRHNDFESQTPYENYTNLPPCAQGRSPEEIEWHETDWERDERSACDPHDYAVNDIGHIQCTECRYSLWGMSPKKVVVTELEKLNGDSELCLSEYEELLEVSRLVKRGRTRELIKTVVSYRLEDGKHKTHRIFYSKNKFENMHKHKHILGVYGDNSDHHFVCESGCWTEFWTDLAMDLKCEEAYHHGYEEGLRATHTFKSILKNTFYHLQRLTNLSSH